MSKTQSFRRALAVLLLAGAAVLMVQLVQDLNRVKRLEIDLAEIHHVRYGLLDPDQWVERISAVVAKRVNEFELTDANREQVVEAVERVLDAMLAEIERYLRQRNLKSGGSWVDQLQGVLQQGLQDLLIDFDKLRKRVPDYAEVVVEQLSTPEAKDEIKSRLIALIREGSEATFAEVDRSRQRALFERYGCGDVDECSALLEARVVAFRVPIAQRLGGLAVLIVSLFLICLTGGGRGQVVGGEAGGFDPFRLLLLTGAILILLLGGILTPMIQVEAGISELTLRFLGEPIVFSDQVLYFQSKSIFEVARILVESGGVDMLLVAVLVTLFSLIFPAVKLVATYLYYFDVRGARASGTMRFFALRSGKWSMADVMVVAIFMAYVGFDALIGNQLQGLASAGSGPSEAFGARVLTTNGTSLEPGFHLFLAFVLASLALSTRLEAHVAGTRE